MFLGGGSWELFSLGLEKSVVSNLMGWSLSARNMWQRELVGGISVEIGRGIRK